MPSDAARRVIRQRLADEVGRLDKEAAQTVALVYPSPYSVGMSSLGYQRVYREIQALPGWACERVFLDDDGEDAGARVESPVSYESLRPLGDFPLLAFSIAYELQLAGLVRMLDAAGIAPERALRTPRDPFVLAGGPITFSNPLMLAGYADAVVLGEAEEIVAFALEAVLGAPDRAAALARLAAHPHIFVPASHGDRLPSIAACDDALLPAKSVIRTPHAELSDMLLIETERGCSRGCTYCVMRRTTNGGMRVVPKETVLAEIPAGTRKVGLVGAAVSDHPRIEEIVRTLAERGTQVGLSSLRPDRLRSDFVAALAAAGHRTLTTALDGPSQRLRDVIERRGREEHYLAAARHAREHGIERLKLYLMIGLPSETDGDIDECARFVGELSKIVPVALGISPFCAKRNTPLDGMPYAGVATVGHRLERLRRGLRGRADVRAVSAKWAWVEHVLSQGGEAEGLAVAAAVRAGGTFAHFKRAFAELGHRPDGRGYAEAVPPVAPDRERKRLAMARG
ncbi:MAG: radical SAM protein [Polyangiaceae bacterium]|nr:radical SAM protein [Polyangiaceae bacterium]